MENIGELPLCANCGAEISARESEAGKGYTGKSIIQEPIRGEIKHLQMLLAADKRELRHLTGVGANALQRAANYHLTIASRQYLIEVLRRELRKT